MKNRIVFFLLAILIITGCGQLKLSQDPPIAPTVASEAEATATVEPTRIVREGTSVLADGQLVAVNPPATLSFVGSGHLLEIHVQPGDVVSQGDLIATLDDRALVESVTNSELQVAQAANSVAQAQLELDDLLNWEPEPAAVALAEANLAAAEAALESAETQDASAGNSLTSARIGVDQAERALADAQEAYDTAFDPGREWEYHITEPSCLPGQGDPIPCTGPSLHIQMKAEREGATRGLQYTQENLEVARAQYSLSLAGLNNDTAINAQANVVSARQALEQARSGPRPSEITAAHLRLEQSQLTLQQSENSLDEAQNALSNARLLAPWQGTILTVELSPGEMAGPGTPIVTLLDTDELQFHTNNLSERDLAQIEPGRTAEIILKAYPNQTLSGVVARIAPQAEGSVGDAAVFTVMIDLVDIPDLNLRPGMTGRANINGA
ncbi:MAG: efflux RND transporter periplasmic adaptor subunit [Candidatus Promineifilaceae bacterium]|nr:efflux RND transporter periplasmic adaptor subunit [Candidatus Promineifilaceae bacterium]